MYSSSGQFVRIATHGAAVTTAVILDAFPKGEDHDGALPATPRLGIHDARGQKVNQCLDDDDTLPSCLPRIIDSHSLTSEGVRCPRARAGEG
jgi:hypothetical protein